MQYLVLCNAAIATSFALEVSLSPALVLSFCIIRMIFRVSTYFRALLLGERDRDMFEIDHSLLYLAEFLHRKQPFVF